MNSRRLLLLAAALLVVTMAVGAGLFFHARGDDPVTARPALPPNAPAASASPDTHTGATAQTAARTAPAARKIHPPGHWNVPVPYINPLGAEADYRDIKYLGNAAIDLRYVDHGNMETTRSTSGGSWQMMVPWDRDDDSYADLSAYIASLGGESFPSGGDGLLVRVDDPQGNLWWGTAQRSGAGYHLSVIKELRLQDDKPLSFTPAEFANAVIYLTTTNSAHRFQSLDISLDSGELQVIGTTEFSQGHYRKAIHYNRTLYAHKTHDYTLDDVPQQAAGAMLWKLSWNAGTRPGRIDITLHEGDELGPVREGERLGALKVHGAVIGQVHVLAPDDVSITHPEFSRYGDRTPEGDTLFWLPSGYWNVVLQPDAHKTNVDNVNTRLVPVSSGQMTVLDVKPLVNEAYGNEALGHADGSERQLKILTAAEHGEQADVSFMLLDAAHPDFIPTPANTRILEGGQAVKITRIERVQAAPSVVLALDSSGSMGRSMGKVLASARAFVRGLPENSRIQVIDFDSRPRLLQGTSKAEVLKSLGTVRANGTTTLFDAIMQGLALLKDRQRPTLVVFTDGIDSSVDHSGPGSSSSRAEVAQAVADSGMPLYTIGFGKQPDKDTLAALAGMSSGTYYPAADTAAVDHVFASIDARLGNQFDATYERPRLEAPSNVPVISLTTDVSLSMDIDPSGKEGNYRIDKVKHLYDAFVRQMPDNALIQLISFSGAVNVSQAFTRRKPEVLQSLGSLVVEPGTDILASTKKTYDALHRIPSDRRVMVFLTDAALDVDKEDKPAFEKLLRGIRKDGIEVLWIGLGTGEAEEAFRWAAKTSGGRYVISEDPAVLSKALGDLLANARQRAPSGLALSLSIDDAAASGHATRYTANRLVDFPLMKDSGKPVTLDTITYQTGLKAPQYGAEAAALVYGSDLPTQGTRVTKRMPVNVQGSNKAMRWSARELYFMSRFRGIDAPSGKHFVAVDMQLKHVQSEGAPYLIADFCSHFFLAINGKGAYPASPATWLAQAPLAEPGQSDITLEPDATRRGVLVFVVPDEAVDTASLNFYDTNNGHITLALMGPPQDQDSILPTLPTSVTAKLSDTFAMHVLASQDQDHIEDVAAGPGSHFKVIEAALTSRVQADLKLNPRKRFYLRTDTPSGPLVVPVNDSTALLPYGFLWPVTLAPGSSNKVRMAFQTSDALTDQKSALYVDLAGGGALFPFDHPPAGTSPAASTYIADGMAMNVNALAPSAPADWPYGNYVIADITVTNTEPGSDVSGLLNAFTLVPDPAHPDSAQSKATPLEPHEVAPSAMGSKLLFGVDDDWAVFENATRRGIIVFELPDRMAHQPLVLQSTQFKTLKLPVAPTPYAHPELLLARASPVIDQRFEQQLALALNDAIERYRGRTLVANKPAADPVQGLGATMAPHIRAPRPTVHGDLKLHSVHTMRDLAALLHSLRWLPSPDDYWHYRNAPAAVVTQGWGTEGDLAKLAGGLLAQLGYSPTLRAVAVTNRGRQALQQLGQVEQAKEEYLPAWAWTDAQGASRVLVVPFMQDLSELSGLVYFPADQEDRVMTPQTATIKVYFTVRPKPVKGMSAITASMSDALAGGGADTPPGDHDVRVLDSTLPLDQLGLDPLDIRTGAGKDGYTAVLENQTMQLPGDGMVDPGKDDITASRIEISLPEGNLVHTTQLQKGESIASVFQTVALNAPDLPAEAIASMQKVADARYPQIGHADIGSVLRWYTRGVLYRFIGGQSTLETKLAADLEVTAGRTAAARALLVTVRRLGEPLRLHTSVDLMQSANEIHRGTAEATHAFNLMSGLFASRLEGAVLPGEKADFMDVWQRSPDDTKLFLSLAGRRAQDLDYMKAHHFPELLIARAKASDAAMLIPTRPTRMYGQDRWEWLEIDPDSYQTIAVADTGEHGSFADYLMALEPIAPTGDDYLAFMAGAFIGVDTGALSIGAYSLASSDYREVIAAAKKYTYAIGEALDGLMSGKDLAKLEYGIGPLKLKLDDADFDYLAKYFEELKTGKTLKASADIPSFKTGFKAGAAYYFKQTKQTK